jgi:hypothetical protein
MESTERPTAIREFSQLPHQKSANCHIKNRPTATFILRKMAGFGNNFVPLQRK